MISRQVTLFIIIKISFIEWSIVRRIFKIFGPRLLAEQLQAKRDTYPDGEINNTIGMISPIPFICMRVNLKLLSTN